MTFKRRALIDMAKLKIDLPEEKIKTAFKLKPSSQKILKEYAIYLSDFHNKKVSEDTILDSMLEKLAKDKDFKIFCSIMNEKKGASKNDIPKKTIKNDTNVSMNN